MNLRCARAEPLDWIAFKKFRFLLNWGGRVFSKVWCGKHSFEGPGAADATGVHVQKTRGNFHNSTIDTLTIIDTLIISPSGKEFSLKNKVNRIIAEHFSRIFKDRFLPYNTFETVFLDGVKDLCKNLEPLLTPITQKKLKYCKILLRKTNRLVWMVSLLCFIFSPVIWSSPIFWTYSCLFWIENQFLNHKDEPKFV